MSPRSARCPSGGVRSNLKSPVVTTVPTGVRMAKPSPSGIEWFTRKGVIVKTPTLTSTPGSTMFSSVESRSLCSFSFPVIRPFVSFEE